MSVRTFRVLAGHVLQTAGHSEIALEAHWLAFLNLASPGYAGRFHRLCDALCRFLACFDALALSAFLIQF